MAAAPFLLLSSCATDDDPASVLGLGESPQLTCIVIYQDGGTVGFRFTDLSGQSRYFSVDHRLRPQLYAGRHPSKSDATPIASDSAVAAALLSLLRTVTEETPDERIFPESRRPGYVLEWVERSIAGQLVGDMLPVAEVGFPTPGARDATMLAIEVAGARESYKQDTGTYPVTPDALAPKYLNDIVRMDPWGKPFQVTFEPDGVTVTSLGADAVRGGRGPNADIIYTVDWSEN